MDFHWNSLKKSEFNVSDSNIHGFSYFIIFVLSVIFKTATEAPPKSVPGNVITSISFIQLSIPYSTTGIRYNLIYSTLLTVVDAGEQHVGCDPTQLISLEVEVGNTLYLAFLLLHL